MIAKNSSDCQSGVDGRVMAPLIERARFAPGDIVRHRMFDFRGVVFDVDPVFSNSDEWYEAIPEAIRPATEQPYYHLLAEKRSQERREGEACRSTCRARWSQYH